MNRHRLTQIALLFSALVLLAGVFDDGHPYASSVRLLGAIGLLAGLGEVRLSRLPRSTNAAYELGRADTYPVAFHEGFEQGRRVGLVVVPFHPEVAVSDGSLTANERRAPGSPMRARVEPVQSGECPRVGTDLLS
jgi:hypothetical protein